MSCCKNNREVDSLALAKTHIGIPAGQRGRGHDLHGSCLAAAQPAHPCQPKEQWKPQSEGHHSTGIGPCQDCPWHYPPQCSATDHEPLGTLMYHAYTYMDTMDHTDRKTIQKYMLTVHIDYVYSYCPIAALTQTEAIHDAGFQ